MYYLKMIKLQHWVPSRSHTKKLAKTIANIEHACIDALALTGIALGLLIIASAYYGPAGRWLQELLWHLSSF